MRCDQVVVPRNFYAWRDYPSKLRRIRYVDAQTQKKLVFLTNNFTLPAETVADLYRCRWQVELFFKWIKQHLQILSAALFEKTPIDRALAGADCTDHNYLSHNQ